MAVFIEAQTDPFAGIMEDQIAGQQAAAAGGAGGVRRPVRGIEIKKDTYAVLRVLKSDGKFINVIDQAGGIMEGVDSIARTSNYTNFFIQTVAEERHEKQQIVDTFGDSFIFFFGESPRMTQVSGILLNSNDFNWRNEFWANYDQYFRGTRLVEQNARLYLIYDDIIIEGYMLNAQAQDDSNMPHLIRFSFSMFVTGYSTISKLGDPNFPQTDSSMDYSKVSTYATALKRSQASRAIQRETNTEITRRRLREASTGGLFGFIGGIIDGIRNNLLNPDPSVAISSAGASVDVGFGSLSISFGASAEPPDPPLRNLPLRTIFRDNKDEFIGGNDYLNARKQASPFNQIYYWQSLVESAEQSLFGFIASTAVGAVFDVMGGSGRATEEISSSGVSPPFSSAGSARSVPFGIIAAKEK